MARELDGKIAAIQLLRAVAALTVAAGHIAFAFADHLPGGLGLSWQGEIGGQIAVMLFFIVSGFVMVIAAQGQFARPGARVRFWKRRFIRIMPPYWIATFMLVAVFLTVFPTPIDPGELARSLVLWPYWNAKGDLRPLPFLWTGWTLFYEMMFYFLFGLFITLPQRIAIGAVAGTLAVLVIAGTWVPPVDPLIFAATRPVSVMFAAGMGIALWRMGDGGAPAWLRWLMLGATLPAMWLVPGPALATAMGWDYLLWAGLPALLIALAALGGPLPVPGVQVINRAGDISYALYLVHVPLAWFWLWFWGRLPGFDAGPWDYMISALTAAIILSWLFHRWVERPLTLALNRRFAAPHRAEDTRRKIP